MSQMNAKLSLLDYNGCVLIDLKSEFANVPEYIDEFDPFFMDGGLEYELNKPKYDGLDSFNRVQGARVILTELPSSYQSGRRASMAKLLGWNKNGIVHGDEYFYHRTHLIAFQLTGKRAICGQFFLGTRELNVSKNIKDSMVEYEKKVLRILNNDQIDVKIFYQVTPIYRGEEIVPRGVRMTAKNYGNSDKQVLNCNFDIYIFNVYQGYTIVCSTGEWKKL